MSAEKKKSRTDGRSIPTSMRERYAAIVALTDAFCREHLNEEYAEMCRRLAGVLARKRPSPLVNGKPNAWACSIVRVIGWVNFLDDKAQTPHMKMVDIDKAFGISSGTAAARSKTIRDMLKIHSFEPEWTLPSRIADNPVVWLVTINGMIMDARYLPREIQEEAFRKGLIPYIPADRGGAEEEEEEEED